MGRLVKLGIWIGVALLLIPVDGDGNGHPIDTATPVQAFLFARDTVEDIRNLCDRRPELCDRGRQLADTVGARAREGARAAYRALDDHLGEPDRSVTTGTVTGE